MGEVNFSHLVVMLIGYIITLLQTFKRESTAIGTWQTMNMHLQIFAKYANKTSSLRMHFTHKKKHTHTKS